LKSYSGWLLKGLANLPCFVLLALLVGAAKLLAVKVATSLELACLPCQAACLVLVE
jgi:hypothetical protein